MIRKIGLTALVCASLTPATAQADSFKTVPTNGLTWTRHGLDAGAYARLDNLAKTFPRRDLKFVLEHPRQTTQSAAGSPSLGQVGPGAVSAFKWSDKDNTGKWIPQGITGSAAAQDDGIVGGHRSLLVSWYQDIPSSPARVSFVNADSLNGGGSTYNSATLVIPSGRTVKPIKTHAGGIAWYQHWLFVAETRVGVRVFDMNYILGAKKLPPTADLNAPFVLPQVGFYKQAKGAGLTFSFVETDRSSPALITGKYADKKANRRIVRWPLDAGSGLPGLQANGAWKMPASNVQGGLMHKGRLLISSSYKPGGGGIGELVAGNPDQAASHWNWPDGAEDLHYAGTSNRVYSLTEKAGDRIVFAIDGASVGLTP
ncbi:hypothetical protein [Solirubrobacter soli]|uniref:hypothetical protein n=1 Tax=Solirubrobacter soli TaxID=363832 RepID=UPI00041E1F1D|nr:hypothetical protein [Solirubrobacter soli]